MDRMIMQLFDDKKYKSIVDFLSGVPRTPATEDELEYVERQLGIRLPESYRRFQLEFGDFCHQKIEVITVSSSVTCSDNILDVRKQIAEYGRDPIYHAYNGIVPDIPEDYIPFSPTGDTYYCFDMKKYDGSECPVLVPLSFDVEHIADNFIDWFVLEIDKLSCTSPHNSE